MRKTIIAITLGAFSLSACAKQSSDISATYVSPVQYERYSCKQLSQEAQRISARAAETMQIQNKKADNDAAVMAIGMILFWPALFFVKGDKETAGQVARLKGEMEAVEQANISMNCGLTFQKAPEAA